LLSRSIKRNANKLALIAALILFMRLVDFFWMVVPNFTGEHFHISWLDVVAPIAIGGLWVAAYCWQLAKMPLIAINDPRYENVREQAHAHAGH
jgi:hypothetical protein